MKIAITGASGKTGYRISEEAVKKGYKVRQIIRKNSKVSEGLESLETTRVSLDNKKELDKALKGIDALVIATGARASLDLTGPAKVDALGVYRQLESCKRVGIKRVILVSSLCTGKLFHPLNLFGLILIWKKIGENFLRNSNFEWTIIRPGGLKETEDIKSENINYSKENTQINGSIPRRLVAQCCIDSLKNKESINKLIEVTSSNDNKKIFAIVATLGTTVRGAIDPIKEISEICKQRNIWLHIDGSIGGIFAITSIPIEGLNNINQANSITINPQKIIGITKTSSLLLVSNMSTLENTFNTGLPYISSKEKIINRGEIGIQGSRPAEIIKLWLGLRFLGLNGIENILNSSIKRKDFFIKNISKNKFDIFSGPLHIVSFLPKKLELKDSDEWTQIKVNELINNNFMLSRPKFKGKYFLRVVMGNYNTKESHIEELLRLLDA